MRTLLPPSSIPHGLVRLNCLAWGLTLRLLIRKLWPWCSRFLIATQSNILYACLHVTPPPPPPMLPCLPHTSTQSPLMEYPHMWLMQSGLKSNLSPKFRLVKPSPLAFTALFCSFLCGMYSYTAVTLARFGLWGRNQSTVTHIGSGLCRVAFMSLPLVFSLLFTIWCRICVWNGNSHTK